MTLFSYQSQHEGYHTLPYHFIVCILLVRETADMQGILVGTGDSSIYFSHLHDKTIQFDMNMELLGMLLV